MAAGIVATGAAGGARGAGRRAWNRERGDPLENYHAEQAIQDSAAVVSSRTCHSEREAQLMNQRAAQLMAQLMKRCNKTIFKCSLQIESKT